LQIKRRGTAERAFIIAIAIYIPRENAAEAGGGKEKIADAICERRRRTGGGGRRGRAAVIEEAGGSKGKGGREGVKVGRANFVIACDGPEARGGAAKAPLK
jgi:hypothetical protein